MLFLNLLLTGFPGGLVKKVNVLLAFFILLLTREAFAFSVSYDQKVSVENNPMATIKVVVKWPLSEQIKP